MERQETREEPVFHHVSGRKDNPLKDLRGILKTGLENYEDPHKDMDGKPLFRMNAFRNLTAGPFNKDMCGVVMSSDGYPSTSCGLEGDCYVVEFLTEVQRVPKLRDTPPRSNEVVRIPGAEPEKIKRVYIKLNPKSDPLRREEKKAFYESFLPVELEFV